VPTRLAAALVLALCLVPSLARAENAAVWFQGNTAGTTTPQYFHQTGVAALAYQEQELPFPAELSLLTVQCPTTVTVGTQTFTIVVDGVVDPTLQCVISAGALNCNDPDGVLPVDPTDRFAMQSVGTAGATAPAGCVMALRVTGPGGAPYDNIISFGGYNPANPASGTFCAPNTYTASPSNCMQATEASAQWIAPSAGTVTGMRVRMDIVVGASSSETFTVKNSTTGLSSDPAVTIPAGALRGSVTTCTTNCTFAAGDQLTVAFTRTGGVQTKGRNIVVTTTGGQIVPTQNGGFTLNGTSYVGWHRSFDNATAATAWPMPNGGIVKTLRASLPSTAANTFTAKICTNVAGTTPTCTGTRPTCTITAGALTCSDTTNPLTLAPGGVFSIQATESGTLGTIAAAVAFEIGAAAVPTVTPLVLTPTPVATGTTVATPTVPAATLTATATLTPTPVVTVTATPLLPTPTPTPLATATATSLQATPTPTALASPTVPAPTWTVTPTPTGTATSAGLTPTPTPTVTNGACVLQPKQLRTKQLGTALTAKGLCP
jgi:hypothetical protein